MITRLSPPGGRGDPRFVALHRDERAPSRAVWVPVRGDRGCTGEVSWRRAAREISQFLSSSASNAGHGIYTTHTPYGEAMKVLETLGNHSTTQQKGIFQYRRTVHGVQIDPLVGQADSLQATGVVTISHDH